MTDVTKSWWNLGLLLNIATFSISLVGTLGLVHVAPVLAETGKGGSGDEMCRIADTAMVDASGIRGLKIQQEVPCYVHNKDKVEKYLRHTINTKIPPHKLRMEEVVYRALGFIPEDFDYKDGIIDLYLSQLGGYYDPEKDHFVMAGWMPAMLQTTIAVHELTHALQDQYFNLEEFIDMKMDNSDLMIARSALVEGDATAVMIDYARKLAGQVPLSKEKGVESLMFQNVLGAALVSSLKQVPESLQMMLIFPYTSGLRFAHALLQKGGYPEIDRAFRKPPNSTEEILHPEKYFQEKNDFITFDSAELKPAGLPEGSEEIYGDTVGEFGISALLSMTMKDKKAVAEASAGWGGDRIVVFGDKVGTVQALIWKTNWDTKKDSEEFLKAFRSALAVRYGDGKEEAPDRWTYAESGKQITLTRTGQKVTWELIGKVG